MNLKSFVTILTQTFKWHPSRCDTFASFVMSLIDQGNVQHHALTKCLSTKANLKARLERVRRFFAYQECDYELFAKNLVLHVFKHIPKMDVIMDRTNWKFGKHDVNYLVLAARVGKITFPLFWSMLDHQGCSDAKARIALLQLFHKVFGHEVIKSFTADREFVGQEWLEYLCQHRIPFLSA